MDATTAMIPIYWKINFINWTYGEKYLGLMGLFPLPMSSERKRGKSTSI